MSTLWSFLWVYSIETGTSCSSTKLLSFSILAWQQIFVGSLARCFAREKGGSVLYLSFEFPDLLVMGDLNSLFSPNAAALVGEIPCVSSTRKISSSEGLSNQVFYQAEQHFYYSALGIRCVHPLIKAKTC